MTVLVPHADAEGAEFAAPIAHKIFEDYFGLPAYRNPYNLNSRRASRTRWQSWAVARGRASAARWRWWRLAVKHWANFDLQLIAIPLGLVAFGEMVLYAISRWPTSGVTVSTPVHQAMYALMGVFALFLLTNFDYRLLRSMAYPLYGMNIGLLAIVLVIGHATYGAQRWLNLGILPLQPSEPMKLLLALALAKYFADNEDRIDRPGVVLTSLAFAVVPAAMVLAQPDLGTSAVLLAIWVGVALMAGVRMVHFVMVGVTALLATPVLLLVLSHVHKFAYMQKRFLIFLNPQQDPLGEGYNVIHALITVGSGGLLGQWFQQGTQSQLGLCASRTRTSSFR